MTGAFIVNRRAAILRVLLYLAITFTLGFAAGRVSAAPKSAPAVMPAAPSGEMSGNLPALTSWLPLCDNGNHADQPPPALRYLWEASWGSAQPVLQQPLPVGFSARRSDGLVLGSAGSQRGMSGMAGIARAARLWASDVSGRRTSSSCRLDLVLWIDTDRIRCAPFLRQSTVLQSRSLTSGDAQGQRSRSLGTRPNEVIGTPGTSQSGYETEPCPSPQNSAAIRRGDAESAQPRSRVGGHPPDNWQGSSPRTVVQSGGLKGTASWYAAAGLIAAVHSWRWGNRPYTVRVCAVRCISVLVQDYCAGCTGSRLIDLSDDAFRLLAPLSQGIVKVTVTR